MMALLRSRRTMFILASVVIVGLVVSAGLGLFNAIGSAPTSPAAPPQGQGQEGQGGQGGGPSPAAPPEVDVLGQAPAGLSYVSDPEADVYCEQNECVRLVMVLTEGGELPEDSRDTAEAVLSHLTERGWEEEAAQGAPEGRSFLTDGDHLLADTSSHDAADAPAMLMLGNAGEVTATP
ncbi:hypothetical protein Q8791_18080 [Nocardiopsis sp. CT-R113]|uniref:Secreted protein n=1 Tax=Nocardiopsis codii TaxID=3065942 RepID=A0ABU7KA49_9ACTN|nr:hypothetical protein [Nocardiopsis sp. CT-R113]MEE2039126.1 hypothetical protein [Nocardiopsis sp. CT-R113]